MMIQVNERAHATILAALRIYQEQLVNNGGEPPFHVRDIATNGDRVQYLNADEIDAVCEAINREDSAPVAAADIARLDAELLTHIAGNDGAQLFWTLPGYLAAHYPSAVERGIVKVDPVNADLLVHPDAECVEAGNCYAMPKAGK